MQLQLQGTQLQLDGTNALPVNIKGARSIAFKARSTTTTLTYRLGQQSDTLSLLNGEAFQYEPQDPGCTLPDFVLTLNAGAALTVDLVIGRYV